MQETASAGPGERLVTGLADRVRGTAKVEVVYGEAREVGEKTIIPVAAVAYLVGGGGGAGTGLNSDGGGEGSGAGAGGGVRVQPVGVLEVTPDETRLVPVIDWTRVITTAIGFIGAWMIVRALRGGRRRK
jgi:uncharacterized spore protein YtfJ